MGLVGSLVWVNSYSKKQCRSIFWRMRAAILNNKKLRGAYCSTSKSGGRKGKRKQLRFQYDPSSYALNFDDGSSSSYRDLHHIVDPLGVVGERANQYFHNNHPTMFLAMEDDSSSKTSPTWVYVIWVRSFQ